MRKTTVHLFLLVVFPRLFLKENKNFFLRYQKYDTNLAPSKYKSGFLIAFRIHPLSSIVLKPSQILENRI